MLRELYGPIEADRILRELLFRNGPILSKATPRIRAINIPHGYPIPPRECPLHWRKPEDRA
jgi:hypothetical protein